MDDSRTVPAISTPELEQFWTDGVSAYPAETFLKNPGHTCCAGIDLPGIGLCHALDCPAAARFAVGLRATAPGRGVVPGEVPPALRNHLRDGLLISLMFAAHHLAKSLIVTRHNFGGVASQICFEYRFESLHGVLDHTASCKTGRVLRLIADLEAHREFELNSLRKEAASASEEGGAPATGFARAPRHSDRTAADALGLRAFLDEDTLRLGELSPQRHGPVAGDPDFGEPWCYKVDDTIEDISIYDREGSFIFGFGKADREAMEWAERIIGCVNSAANTEAGPSASLRSAR